MHAYNRRDLCNISKTSASVSLGVPNTEKLMKMLLLFRGVWKSLCLSLNCWQRKFVIELEQNIGKEISTENCLWNSI